MSPGALFRIYPMAKLITNAAPMMLVETGQLRLSGPVMRYVPGFKDAPVMVARGGRLSVEPGALVFRGIRDPYGTLRSERPDVLCYGRE